MTKITASKERVNNKYGTKLKRDIGKIQNAFIEAEPKIREPFHFEVFYI